jgi:hypothetical protein
MKTTELRLGNIVRLNNKPTLVESISDEGINGEFQYFAGSAGVIAWEQNIQPIYFTHEMAMLIGFIQEVKSDGIQGNGACLYLLNGIPISNSEGWWSVRHQNVHFKYVHEFQNLYPFLFRKELSIEMLKVVNLALSL